MAAPAAACLACTRAPPALQAPPPGTLICHLAQATRTPPAVRAMRRELMWRHQCHACWHQGATGAAVVMVPTVAGSIAIHAGTEGGATARLAARRPLPLTRPCLPPLLLFLCRRGGGLELARPSIAAALLSLGLRALVDELRLTTLGRVAFQQIQLDVHYLRPEVGADMVLGGGARGCWGLSWQLAELRLFQWCCCAC